MKRMVLAGGLLAAALTLAACGGTTNGTADVGDAPAAGTCLEGTPDCDDTSILDDYPDAEPSAGMCAAEMPDCDDTGVLDDPIQDERCLPDAVGCDDTPAQDEPTGDVFDSQAATTQAEAMLGLSETELGPDVRIGRRGEEQMMLTEDYVLGRMTVQLDINDMDEWIVTAVTVELPDTPQTFTRYLT